MDTTINPQVFLLSGGMANFESKSNIEAILARVTYMEAPRVFKLGGNSKNSSEWDWGSYILFDSSKLSSNEIITLLEFVENGPITLDCYEDQVEAWATVESLLSKGYFVMNDCKDYFEYCGQFTQGEPNDYLVLEESQVISINTVNMH